MRAETGLTASVGVATSKLVAKIASDMRKPDGLVVVPPGHARPRSWPRCPCAGCGAWGRRWRSRSPASASHTIGDLAALDPPALERRLGTHGHDLLRLARGVDDRAGGGRRGRGEERGPRAHLRRGHRATARAAADAAGPLPTRWPRRLREHGLRGAHGHAQVPRRALRDPDPRRTPWPRRTDAGDALFAVAWRLFEKVHGARRVRLLGIYASGFGRRRSSGSSRPRAASRATACGTRSTSASGTAR